jgi:hypothetical protein
MPPLAASRSTVSTNVRPSISMTNLKTSPPTPQPKQWYEPTDGRTLNDGDFSSWNGHRPLRDPPPAFLRVTYCSMTSSMRVRSRTSWMSSSLMRPAMR